MSDPILSVQGGTIIIFSGVPSQPDQPSLVGIRALQGLPDSLRQSDDDDLLASGRDRGVEPGRIEQPACQQGDDDVIGFGALGAVASADAGDQRMSLVRPRSIA
jgi:hypothetical protein